jgi:hypothetical protein
MPVGLLIDSRAVNRRLDPRTAGPVTMWVVNTSAGLVGAVIFALDRNWGWFIFCVPLAIVSAVCLRSAVKRREWI